MSTTTSILVDVNEITSTSLQRALKMSSTSLNEPSRLNEITSTSPQRVLKLSSTSLNEPSGLNEITSRALNEILGDVNDNEYVL